MKTYFTYSPLVKGMTLLTALLLIGAIAALTFLYEGSPVWQVLLVLMLSLALVVPVLYAPWYYEMRADGLYVRRLGFGRLYSYVDYELDQEQGPIPIDCLRLWGSGGYCGFLGHYYSKARGRFVMIATTQHGPFYLLRHRQTGRQIVVCQ